MWLLQYRIRLYNLIEVHFPFLPWVTKNFLVNLTVLGYFSNECINKY